jgi:hypothetical protein
MKTEIDQLLERYFEGETTAAEEKMIRQHLAQCDPEGDQKNYIPFFRYLENESEALAVLNEIRHEPVASVRKRLPIRRYGAIAAVAASLFVAVLLFTPEKNPSNYVWVDGKRITDPQIVREYAELSFGEVQPENDIIEDQLRFVLE